jgi:hypothetical protein
VDHVPSTERDDRLGEVLASCLEATEDGRPLDCPTLLARYPEFAVELERFFALHVHANVKAHNGQVLSQGMRPEFRGGSFLPRRG